MNDSQYSAEIGKRIYSARQDLRMSRKELGDKIGMAETSIKKYEDGSIKSINIKVLSKLAKALEVSEEYLFCLDLRNVDDKDSALIDSMMKMNDFELFVETYNKLEKEQRKVVLSLMQQLIKE